MTSHGQSLYEMPPSGSDLATRVQYGKPHRSLQGPHVAGRGASTPASGWSSSDWVSPGYATPNDKYVYQ